MENQLVANKKWGKRVFITALVVVLSIIILLFLIPLAIFYIDKQQPQISEVTPDNNYIIRKDKANFNFEVTEKKPLNFFPLSYIVPLIEDGDHRIKNCSLKFGNNVIQTINTIEENSSLEFKIDSIPEGEHQWSIECRDSSWFKNTGRSELRNFLGIKPKPPIVEISVYDPSKIQLTKSINIYFTPKEDLPKNITPEILKKYTKYDVMPITSCALIIDEKEVAVLNDIKEGEKNTITYNNIHSGSHKWYISCIGASEEKRGKSEINDLMALIPYTAMEAYDISTNLDNPGTTIWIEVSEITTDGRAGKALGKLSEKNTFNPVFTIDEYQSKNGIMLVSLTPSASLKEQVLTVKTDKGEIKIYLPEANNEGGGTLMFYVADDGSTFWQSKIKGASSYPTGTNPFLTGFEALNQNYLAKASPSLSFAKEINYTYDSQKATDELNNQNKKTACPQIPCIFIGKALNNNEGDWDVPEEYVSASYPYEIVIQEAEDLDMKLDYQLGHDIYYSLGKTTETPNTMKVTLDDKQVYSKTQLRGDPVSAKYTAVFNLGLLAPGSHYLKFIKSDSKGDLALSKFSIDTKGAFGSAYDQIDKNSYGAKDDDNDGLVNLAEAIYQTNASNPDTDGDGYKDGDEVKNGYNPKGSGKL